MENPESELLVDVPPRSTASILFGNKNASANDGGYGLDMTSENLVQDGKKATTPDREGNINCAMDIFAPDQSSVSSSNSRVSSSSTLGAQHHSTSSEPKDTSDSDKVGHIKVKLSNNYMTLLNEHDQQDATSVASDSSAGDAMISLGRETQSPRNRPSTPTRPPAPPRLSHSSSPHFPKSNITFPSSNPAKTSSTKQWTVFGEDKENKLPSADRQKIFPVRPPPAVPDRKSLRDRTAQARASPVVMARPPLPSPSPSADLLSMGTDDLELHLSDASSPAPPLPGAIKPAIPPRRNLFSTSSTASGSGSHADDSDHELLSLPEPEGHVNHAHMSSGSCSPVEHLQKTIPFKSIPGPPVPPRRNVAMPKPNITVYKPSETPSKALDFATFPSLDANSEPSFNLDVTSLSPTWVNFDDVSPPSSKAKFASSTNLLSDTNEEAQDNIDFNNQCIENELSGTDPSKQEEDPHWKKTPSSPDVPASATKKKGTGGIGYHCLENDDCDNLGSSDKLDGKTNPEQVTISLPENDMSPEKPQSQWATFQNEEDEEENQNVDVLVDNISCVNSSPSLGINSSGLAGSLNDMDGDLEDDFGLGINRLSTEMPDLKGFNRADKGSQNNLVDFSDDRGSAAVSMGSRDDPDDDVETIFDLTAQGDSLKRRRPKGAVNLELTDDVTDSEFLPKKSNTPIPCDKTPYHVGPAGIDDAVFAEEDLFDFTNKTEDYLRVPTPHSSLPSRSGTPGNIMPEPVATTTAKSAISTNPFWSSPSAAGPSSASQSSSTDSPFDNIVFRTSKSPPPTETSSKASTPVRVNLVASPATTQLVRIPPPPQSQSRSSTRSRRKSQTNERVRISSKDSSCAKKLDLDSASDSSVKAATLSSSRADTPIQTPTIYQETSDTSMPASAPMTLNEDIFDPFSTQPNFDYNNSTTISNNTNSDDLFSWVDETPLSKNVPAEVDTRLEKENVQEENRDVTLVLDSFSVTDSVQNNNNANAQVHTAQEIISEAEIEDPDTDVQNQTATPDPLLELQKTTSVESPIGVQSPKYSILPEVDLVSAKSSWDVFMRFPPMKRTMSNRKWVPIHIKLICDQIDNPQINMYYTAKAGEPFRTISLANHQMQMSKPKLQAHYSDEGQVLGKLHAVKMMVVNYKEKQTFSPRRSLTRNASGFKHTCRGKQSTKFGFTVHYDVMSFCKAARDAMFAAHKRIPKSKVEEHAATVKYHSRDEFLIDVQDELQAIVHESGLMKACKVRVYFFVSSFLSGDPVAKITVNDRKMEGKEVVRREDIIPTSLGGWIDVRDHELHESCTLDSYEKGGSSNVGACVFYPPDACKFELMRFATSYTETELPVIVKSTVTVKGARIELRCILRMSGHHSANKDPLTQIACEDVMIRFPVPDEWGTFFRVDGRFRNHSVRAKRAAKQRRRPSVEAGVNMEASVGVAKYERAYKAIVWRLPRLPEKNAVQNTPRVFTCRIELCSDRDLERLKISGESADEHNDEHRCGVDDKFHWCEVEYTMPGPTASNVCVRSLSLPNTDRAEKFVSYQSHYLYKVGVNVTVEPVGANGEEEVASFCKTQ